MNLNDNPRASTLAVTNGGVIMDADGEEDFEITETNLIFIIDGLFYTVASDDGDIKLDGFTIASKYSALFLACVSTAGTITVTKSAEVLNADITNGTAILHWPEPTAGTCPFAGMVVTNDSDAVFTGGTTDLDAADITADVYDLSTVPATGIATLAT